MDQIVFVPQANLYLHFVQDITKRKKSQKELERTTIEMVQALSQIVEAKDKYTGDHLNRVQEYALNLGKKLALSSERPEQLRYAAELHDIGKVKVRDRILGKKVPSIKRN